MQVIRCETVQHLRESILFLLFGESASFLACEEVEQMLQLEIADLVSADELTDEWFEQCDSITKDDIRKKVEADDIPLLRSFTPGVLIFWVEDGYDRLGTVRTRIFSYYTDDNISFETNILNKGGL